ncbi:MAG: hypothetical protein GEU90_09080 [Gemmatimonas sp.]|nr:hypothetical protein [Gemmatimonas sp.]
MVGFGSLRRRPGDEEQFDRLLGPRVGRIGAGTHAGFGDRRNGSRETRPEAGDDVGVEGDRAVLVRFDDRLELRIVLMCLVPGGQTDARCPIEVELPTRGVEGEARLDADLAGEGVVLPLDHRRVDQEPPDDAFAV